MNQFNSPYGASGQYIAASPSSHLCQYLKKPVVFTIGLLSTLSAILSLAVGVILSGTLNTAFGLLAPYINSSQATAFEFAKNFFSTYMLVIVVISTIMALLASVPYIIMFFKSRGGKNPTDSVTVLQVIAVINLVGACFSTLVVVLYFFIFAFAASFISSSSSFNLYGSSSTSAGAGVSIAVLIIFFIIFSIVIALNLAYCINKVRLASSAKKILNDCETRLKGAGFVGAMNVIMSISQILSSITLIIMVIALLASPSSAYATAHFNGTSINVLPEIINTVVIILIIACVVSVLSSAVMIAKAIAAFGAKRHMSYFNGSPQAPTGQYNNGYASNSYNSGYNPYQSNYQSTDSQYNSTYTDTSNYGNPYSNDSRNGGGY